MVPELRWITVLYFLISSMLLVHGDEDIVQPVILDVTDQNRGTFEYQVTDEQVYVTISVEVLEDPDGVFDPVVWLVNSDDHLIAYQDNEPHIERLLLLPGIYTIFVDSFNGVFDATVAVTVESVDPFNVQMDVTETIERQIVTLPAHTVYRYPLRVSEEDILTLTARDLSGALDPVLTILNAETDEVLVSSDDHSRFDLELNALDSHIEQWTPPADMDIAIQVHDFVGASGRFELLIESIP